LQGKTHREGSTEFAEKKGRFRKISSVRSRRRKKAPKLTYLNQTIGNGGKKTDENSTWKQRISIIKRLRDHTRLAMKGS